MIQDKRWWNIAPEPRERWDGTTYVNRWVATTSNGFTVHIQAHTMPFGLYIEFHGKMLHHGECFPRELVHAMSEGEVSMHDPYLQVMLNRAVVAAHASDIAYRNADRARDWIYGQASVLVRFGTEDEPGLIKCVEHEDGALEVTESHPNDEGWSTTSCIATPNENGTWELMHAHHGRDCEGRLDTYFVSHVRDGEIVEGPNWQRDHTAEAAGY